jgi:signal transduction histidine kinase
MDQRLKLTIFRIVQEQLNNIIKHSQVTHAKTQPKLGSIE